MTGRSEPRRDALLRVRPDDHEALLAVVEDGLLTGQPERARVAMLKRRELGETLTERELQHLYSLAVDEADSASIVLWGEALVATQLSSERLMRIADAYRDLDRPASELRCLEQIAKMRRAPMSSELISYG